MAINGGIGSKSRVRPTLNFYRPPPLAQIYGDISMELV
jgi:hypothetical protein